MAEYKNHYAWAIGQRNSLFYGTNYSKRGAICNLLADYEERFEKHRYSSRLNDEQKAAWKELQARGYFATKVVILWKAPKSSHLKKRRRSSASTSTQ